MSNSYVTPWTVSCQAPLSMGFSRQEYWSGLLFPSPGDLSDPGMEPVSSALVGRFFTTEPAGKPKRSLPNTFVCVCVCVCLFLVLVVLGLCCWVPGFSSCGEQASHCPGFSCSGAQDLGLRPH